MLSLLSLLACHPAPDTGLAPLDWSFAFAITVTEYRAPGGGEGAAWATVDNREVEAPPWDLALAAGDCGFYEVRPWRPSSGVRAADPGRGAARERRSARPRTTVP